MASLEDVRRGPLPYSQDHNLPFGQSWNTNSSRTLVSSSRWASSLDHVHLATSVEIPYATAGGVEVTAPGARAFGRDLARALRVYLLDL